MKIGLLRSFHEHINGDNIIYLNLNLSGAEGVWQVITTSKIKISNRNKVLFSKQKSYLI